MTPEFRTDNLFISASNGIYMFDESVSKATCILGVKHTPGWFKKQSRGYFGICSYNQPDKILVSSRERLSTCTVPCDYTQGFFTNGICQTSGELKNPPDALRNHHETRH